MLIVFAGVSQFWDCYWLIVFIVAITLPLLKRRQKEGER